MAEHDGMLNRRQFLAGASVAAWLSATHAPGVGRAAPGWLDASGRGRVARIARLRLETAAPLSQMGEFYGRLLGLDVLDEGSAGLSIEAGESQIHFVPAESGGVAAPFYHFAFNIPQNKLLAAREWQRQRTPLIAPDAGLRDPRFPDDVVHFVNWNAHSVFFLGSRRQPRRAHRAPRSAKRRRRSVQQRGHSLRQRDRLDRRRRAWPGR